jgi:hypothetical protein
MLLEAKTSLLVFSRGIAHAASPGSVELSDTRPPKRGNVCTSPTSQSLISFYGGLLLSFSLFRLLPQTTKSAKYLCVFSTASRPRHPHARAPMLLLHRCIPHPDLRACAIADLPHQSWPWCRRSRCPASALGSHRGEAGADLSEGATAADEADTITSSHPT